MAEKISDKKIALLKKLKALADRGVGGEKENAQSMLDKMLKENNLTLEDLEGETVDIHLIKYTDEFQKKFLHQIISSVMGKISTWTHPHYKKQVIFESTVAEYIEIKAKYRFYFRDLIEQRQLFYKAYIQRNELYIKDSKPEDRELTQKEMEELLKMSQMMLGIDKKTFHKQLENNKS